MGHRTKCIHHQSRYSITTLLYNDNEFSYNIIHFTSRCYMMHRTAGIYIALCEYTVCIREILVFFFFFLPTAKSFFSFFLPRAAMIKHNTATKHQRMDVSISIFQLYCRCIHTLTSHIVYILCV